MWSKLLSIALPASEAQSGSPTSAREYGSGSTTSQTATNDCKSRSAVTSAWKWGVCTASSVALLLGIGVPGSAPAQEGWEWEPDEGYHEEEWYDPSDWFDDDETIDYEYDWGDYQYGYGYDDEGVYDDYDYGYDDDWYYTDDWYEDEGAFDTWYE